MAEIGNRLHARRGAAAAPEPRPSDYDGKARWRSARRPSGSKLAPVGPDGHAPQRVPVASKREPKEKAGSGNLSAWLDGEAKEGRRRMML